VLRLCFKSRNIVEMNSAGSSDKQLIRILGEGSCVGASGASAPTKVLICRIIGQNLKNLGKGVSTFLTKFMKLYFFLLSE